ncbi:MAG TPA: hypothetical protein VFW25_02850 [Silvibacterium sp.]|nr:hypothetical protein [Silvibacterium sp.]
MNDDTVVVLTARSIERMVNQGGSQAWRLVPAHARQMDYIVCARNAKADWGDGHEAHRSAFLIARVRDVVPSPERPDRWLVRFAEYAPIDLPEFWRKGDRNPVRYGSLNELGIEPHQLNWHQMPVATAGTAAGLETVSPFHPKIKPLTISEAKHGLAMNFNVPVEAVEITIRA